MAQPTKNTVPVAQFRNKYNHLYRKLNDYHACCSADEVRAWKHVTQNLLEEVSELTCTRASADDRETHAKAVAAVTECLAAADQRIEAYGMKAAAKAALAEPARPALRLIQGGKRH